MILNPTRFFLICFLSTLWCSQGLRSQADNIDIKYEILDDNSVQFSYSKKLPGSYYLKVTFPKLENSYPTVFQDVVKYPSGNLIKLRPIDEDKSIRFSYSYNYIKGVPNPKVDSLFRYILPFKNYRRLEVIEATNLYEIYFGTETPIDWKSYIVMSKKADTVCSMRKGIVVGIKNTFGVDASVGKTYSSQRNSLTIEHEDGTYAAYTGIKRNSFFVKLGQTVYPQQKLGILEAYSEDNHRLDFNVYYLYDHAIQKKQKLTMKDYKSRDRFLTPYFSTPNGIHNIKSGEIYVSEANEAVLFKEFTKKEKKAYKKNPDLFQ